MARESFDDPEVAEVMNRLFVNVKVDREERPDIDQIYQTAHQMLAQRPGGWPLTMFLSPDGTPFFGGTYFPKTARPGRPGFADLNVGENIGAKLLTDQAEAQKRQAQAEAEAQRARAVARARSGPCTMIFASNGSYRGLTWYPG